MVDRLYSVLVALALGLLVWVYARSRERETLDNQPIPVEVRLAPGQAESYQMDSPEQSQIRVTFVGSPNAVRELRWRLSQGELGIRIEYTVPEDQRERAVVEDSIRVDAADIRVPSGITVLPVEGRNRVPVVLTRLGEKTVKVRVEGMGSEESRLKITPEVVKVKGARVALDRLVELPLALGTQGVESLDLTPGRPLRVSLPKVWENRPITCEPETVIVRVDPRAPKTYTLTDVPVQFLCPPGFGLRPRFLDDQAGKLQIRIQGPDSPAPPKISAFIDLTTGKFLPGPNFEPVQIQLPKDFSLAQDPPGRMSFELIAAEAPPKPLGGSLPGQ